MEKPGKIAPPKGKLGILTPGMGAVSTTFMAGVELVRKGKAQPVGSLTQLGTIRLGKRTDGRSPLVKKFVPLAELKDLTFGGWDIFKDNAYQSAANAGVLNPQDLAKVKTFLSGIKPMTAAFDHEYVKMIDGPNIKKGKNKYELALKIKEDIANYRKTSRVSRLVMCWCGSTEVFVKPEEVHSTPEKFVEAMKSNHPAIAPSMLYAWAAITSGVPFANGAPNLTVDFPAIQALAQEHGVPICGKDFKTGQTLMKTILAPGFKARMLGLDGWFSTNILGNRDGEVLEDPGSFKTKEESKLSVLEYILQPQLYPMLYGKMHHKVRINYYPPRGDNKEGWDNIDIFGWLGYPMQIKVDFLCRDSILAAPIVLDLVLFLDLAQRAGMNRIQDWLSYNYNSPMTAPGLDPEQDLLSQSLKLKNTLRGL
ncbi:MAG: inositol-3-phosphate synthase, partial [Candidatus Acidiferrum sp.]